ncbi:hypothetical protein CC80DRAFT_69106 [Byssothecium circinans]|uniref:Uncharacterized protein n=1 Tax=Byssothecium circinans TaxID=147558 RepID=A0A6A5TWJ0_9PLEO|nr:hypothetical protein CC80DRAFT_69106 [Byssothecium circinans]
MPCRWWCPSRHLHSLSLHPQPCLHPEADPSISIIIYLGPAFTAREMSRYASHCGPLVRPSPSMSTRRTRSTINSLSLRRDRPTTAKYEQSPTQNQDGGMSEGNGDLSIS